MNHGLFDQCDIRGLHEKCVKRKQTPYLDTLERCIDSPEKANVAVGTQR